MAEARDYYRALQHLADETRGQPRARLRRSPDRRWNALVARFGGNEGAALGAIVDALHHAGLLNDVGREAA